jgi:hypothetical protein
MSRAREISPESQRSFTTRRLTARYARLVRTVAFLYLWLGLPLMLVSRVALTVGGFGLLLAVGMFHLALLLLVANWTRQARGSDLEKDARSRDAGSREERAARALLIAGPAIFVLGAATGAPSPAFPANYAWNTIGLLIGSLVTVAGLIAVGVRLWRAGEYLSASIGAGAMLIATAVWLPSLALRIAVLATGANEAWAAEEVIYTHFRSTNASFTLHQDSWRAVLVMWTYVLSTLHKILLFGVLVIVTAAAARADLITRASARVLGGLAVTLLVLITFGRALFHIPAMQLAWGISSIPFVTYIPPYFLGLALLSRRAQISRDS